MGEPYTSRGPKPEDLSSYFDRSASAVRGYADMFERAYARPAINVSLAFFDEYPISFTFIAIFSLLSLIPVISFIGFSLFAIASFTVVALTCALIASVAVELALISLLLFALLANLFVSVSLTVVAISTYLVVRFAILVRTDGRVGVSEWATETKGHFLHAKAKILPKFDYHEGSDTSTGSVVVVQGNDDGVQRVES